MTIDHESDEDFGPETTPLVVGKKQPSRTVGIHKPVVVNDLSSAGLFLRNLERHFGYKLLVILMISQHLMKGFASSLIGPAAQYLYASYKVGGPRMQIFSGVTSLPWAMKPVIGLISDCLPLRGYNKGPYMLISSLAGVCAFAALGALPASSLSLERVVGCLFLIQLQFSTCDLLAEAKYAEKMQAKPQHGPDLLSFVWFGLQVGGLMATICIGPIMERMGEKAPYLIALVPASIILMPVARNFMEERPRTDAEVQEHRTHMFHQKEACLLCVLMFAGTISLTVLGISYDSVFVNAFAAIAVAVVMLFAFSVVLRPVIAKVNAFFLIQTSLGVSIGGASFYFYTDTEEQYPDGPHFSMVFFTSVLGVVGSVCSLIGILSYQRFMKDWTYRNLLLMTNVALSLLSTADVILLSRLNKRVGIPDTVFVLGANVLQSVVAQWMWMPGVVILSQLCPKGMEATMYALLAGCHNLGNTIASNCGALVLHLLGCEPSGQRNETDQFKHLWVGSALATVLPMCTLLLLPWLIPDARQTDKILEEGDRDATSGSLWRRWTSAD